MPIPIPRLRLLPLACLFAIAVACAPEPDGSESPESLDTVTSAITLPGGYSDAQVTAVGAPGLAPILIRRLPEYGVAEGRA